MERAEKLNVKFGWGGERERVKPSCVQISTKPAFCLASTRLKSTHLAFRLRFRFNIHDHFPTLCADFDCIRLQSRCEKLIGSESPLATCDSEWSERMNRSEPSLSYAKLSERVCSFRRRQIYSNLCKLRKVQFWELWLLTFSWECLLGPNNIHKRSDS